jgi:hypothetical protein
MGESSGLGADKAGKKRFEVKKVTFPWTLLICLFKTLTLNIDRSWECRLFLDIRVE